MEQKLAESTGGAAAGPRAYGFLTAVESGPHGVFGGYLLVDPLGRPLEFHCTAPVKVSRAQQILFGSTLQSHLHGQQIGGTLLAEGTVTPEMVLTDLEPMLHVRSHTKLPVAFVRDATLGAPAVVVGSMLSTCSFTIGNASVSPHATDASHGDDMRERLEELAAAVDLCEPFERIRAAIDERSGGDRNQQTVCNVHLKNVTECSMTADSKEIRPMHSWRAPELAIPSAVVAPHVDPRVIRPAALRFPIDVPRPAVTRIGLFDARPLVQSFRFQPSVAPPPAVPKRAADTAAASATIRLVPPSKDSQADAEAGSPAPPSKRTRIAPPADVVKLSERFFYLLQPDLETILETSSLEFPRQPFPFQFDGMAFLMPRHGAVLADEMGLGKSMQAISSIRLLVRSGEARRVLVVCPKGLVSNWTRELADWAPEILVAVIEGDQQRRRWQWSLADVPVKVANYEVLVRDRELIAELGLSFDLMVLDEAQRIKNRSSQTSEAVRSVSRRRSWALTGTPVENSSDDLVGVFEFIAPGHLNERMSPKVMGAAAADHVLRRTKDKVLKDMPPRLNRDERIELSAEQRETYRRAEEEGVLRLADLGQEATIQNVFELVLRLKQICNFDTFTGESAKLDCLEADLEEIHASGKKALVFSQWVETLGRLRGKLSRFGALEYHGGMSTAARDEAIRQFKSEKQHSVLLLSYGAGAVGLNLQFSQYVFLFDRWWNPAVEDQAINRAHRIGAVGAVTVTRFLSANTIEERIDEVLRRKRDLSDTILSQAEAPAASGLTQDDLFALFKLASPRSAPSLSAA